MLLPCNFLEFWRIKFPKPLVMRTFLAPYTLKPSGYQVMWFCRYRIHFIVSCLIPVPMDCWPLHATTNHPNTRDYGRSEDMIERHHRR